MTEDKIRDLQVYGVTFEKDGKRIPPEDVYIEDKIPKMPKKKVRPKGHNDFCECAECFRIDGFNVLHRISTKREDWILEKLKGMFLDKSSSIRNKKLKDLITSIEDSRGEK